MKIAWYSNSPTAPTGYGEQTAQVTRRLRDAGHEVNIISNYGQGSGNGIVAWDGIPVWPQGVTQYSTDTLDPTIAAVDAELVISLYDVWPLRSVSWAGRPTLHWTPVDHDPVGPEVYEFFVNGEGKQVRPIVAMSEFGQRKFAEVGLVSAYIPHAIERVFSPGSGEEWREAAGIPNDAFVIGIVAANIGAMPPRKMWLENLQAAAEVMRAHDDVFLYLHTDLHRPNGVDLRYWMGMVGIPEDRVRAIDPFSYRVGTTTKEKMAEMYRGFDVLLAASGGEGFGIPVAEAMRCGVPAVVTDFSAQPEIVGDTGWKVGYQKFGDLGQGSWLAVPNVADISESLEAAYSEKGTDKAVERSHFAYARADERYDADRVFATGWLPLLQQVAEASTKAKAEAAGITVPPGGLVGPDGTPLNRAQRRALNKKRNR